MSDGIHDTLNHECVADHCVACCPVARSYSDGFEQAKDIFSQPLPRLHLDPVLLVAICGVVMMLLYIRTERRRANRAN
jgi:hypothetical protein